MKSISVLLVSHEMTYTGAPRSLYNLAKCFLEEGSRVSVLSLEAGDFFDGFVSLGLDVVNVSGEELKSERFKKVIAGFDLVVANTVFCAETALAVQGFTKTVLFLGEARNIGRIVRDHSINKETIGMVKNIVCVSAYAKRAIEKYLNRKDIAVIHNYTEDYGRRDHVCNPSGVGAVHFLVSGTVEPRKGQDLAMEAFRNLSPELRKRASLHVLGRTPVWSEKYLKSLGSDTGIYFKNEIRDRTELFEYYKKMDVILVPSRDEACSLVALEAAMLGKALIVSSHVGGKYICGKEFHFKSGDAKALQEKMERFLKEPGLIEEAGIQNRKAFEKRASKSNTKRELEAYLKSLGIAGPDDGGVGAGSQTRRGKNARIEKLAAEIKEEAESLNTGGKAIVPIVFATDSNYAPFAAAVIMSICDNKSDDRFYNIYVLYDETLTHSAYEMLCNIQCPGVSVTPVDISACIDAEKLYLSGHYSRQMYYRWLIPQIFRHYPKTLYLDCDLAVCGDVAQLYDTDIGSNCVGMVNNTVRTSFRSYVEENLGLPVDEYYNSGVMLFNNDACIKDRIKEKCVDFINRDRDLLCPDQDAINVCCRGKIYRLPDEWNFQWHHMIPGVETGGFASAYRERYKKTLKKGPKIIHYTSHKKPWDEPELNLADHFWRYFERIPGFDRLMKKNAYGKKGIERTIANATGSVDEKSHYRERIDFLQNSLDETRNSLSYKVGRWITAVPRRVRHMLTGAPI